MADKKLVRDIEKLLDAVYLNLMNISGEIDEDPKNAKLIDAFDSLLSTYLDVMVEES